MDVKPIIKKFYKQHRYSKELGVEVVEDLYAACLKCAGDPVSRALVQKNKDNFNRFAGIIPWGLPREEIKALVVSKVFDHNFQNNGEGTIIHELTHAHDYYAMMSFFGIENTSDFVQFPYYHAFLSFSEFHAKYVEYKFNRENKNPTASMRDKIAYAINEKAIIAEELERMLRTIDEGIYLIFQFIGKYSALYELFPSVIKPLNPKYLEKILEPALANEVTNLFEIVYENRNFPHRMKCQMSIIDDWMKRFSELCNRV